MIGGAFRYFTIPSSVASAAASAVVRIAETSAAAVIVGTIAASTPAAVFDQCYRNYRDEDDNEP